MDLTKLSDADLLALKAGDYSKLSDQGLMALKGSSAPQPSGSAAAIAHETEAIKDGTKETLHDFLGVGDRPENSNDNYVPANVTNGSWNPLKWNWSQLPQKAAEQVPGITEGAIGAGAGSKIGSIGGMKGRILGGLVGAALPYVLNNAGNDARSNAIARTGDQNAEPSAGDLARSGLTDTAAGLVQGIGPSRFVPGLNAGVKAVGTAGLKAAAGRYLTTVGDNALGGAAADATRQVGSTIGTDKGVQFDPTQTVDAALGNAAAAGMMGAPRAIADAHTAVSQRVFGGDNAQASAAYFKRVQDNAGDAGLANTKNAYDAHENTVANLKKELGQVDTSGMQQDTANAIALAKSDKPLTEDHVKAIESADPQAGFLARQLYVAQQAEGFGSIDRQAGRWAGGLSGIADKHVVETIKRHAAISGLAGLAGVTLHGSYAIPTLAGATGIYGVTRGVDTLTGMRSPLKGMAERYADANVPTRLAPPPQAPQTPPQDLSQGPWGSRPPQPSVPQVAPPEAPAQPPMDANAMNANIKGMLLMASRRRQVAEEQAAAAQPAPASMDATAMNNDIRGMLMMAAARRKVDGQRQAEQLAEDSHVINENGGLDNLRNPAFGKRANELLSAARANARLTAVPEEDAPPAAPGTPPDTPQSPQPRPAPQAPPQPASQVPPQPSPIQPSGPKPWDALGMFTPLADHQMAFRAGMTPAQIADKVVGSDYNGLPELRKQSVRNSIMQTHAARDVHVGQMMEQHPEAAGILQEMLRQLKEPQNSDQNHGRRIIKHYTNLLSGGARDAVRAHFDRRDVQDAIWPKPEPRIRKKSNDRKDAEAS